jgi:hypothetical protein
MAGILRIFRRSPQPESHAYQVTYNMGGHSYARVFDDEEALDDFLTTGVGMDDTDLGHLWDVLHAKGNATLSDIEIAESEAVAMRMVEEPSDL